MKKKIAVIKFPHNNTFYDFKTDLVLCKGDYVVCDTSMGYDVGIVVEFKELSKKANKWIIQKVNLEQHNDRIKKEEKIKHILSKMEKRKEELEDMHFYKMLAREDIIMAKLLEELNYLKEL